MIPYGRQPAFAPRLAPYNLLLPPLRRIIYRIAVGPVLTRSWGDSPADRSEQTKVRGDT